MKSGDLRFCHSGVRGVFPVWSACGCASSAAKEIFKFFDSVRRVKVSKLRDRTLLEKFSRNSFPVLFETTNVIIETVLNVARVLAGNFVELRKMYKFG